MRAAIAALAFAAAGCVPHTEAALDYCTIAEPRATLLLVDRTTSYNDLDRQILAQGLERIYEGLQPGERMVVQTITHEYAATERVFDQCVPGCPEGESGPFSTCSQFTIEEDLAAFRAALSDSARGVVSVEPDMPRSEIMMTIAMTTREQQAHGLHRLFVFSDLLENSPSTFPWPAIQDVTPEDFLARAGQLNARPDLAGSDVAVFGFGRDHTAERRSLDPLVRERLVQAWGGYFAEGQADEVTISQRLD